MGKLGITARMDGDSLTDVVTTGQAVIFLNSFV
jgi:hypothetical protein